MNIITGSFDTTVRQMMFQWPKCPSKKWPNVSAKKNTPLIKMWNPKPKTFFHCRLEDLSHLSRVWMAL